MAIKSNDFHFRRWRGVDTPKYHCVGYEDIRPREFAELGTEGVTWDVKRLAMPRPVFCENISVVIPTWNHASGLMKALKSLEGKVGEVIVVDDGCEDDTQQRLQAVRIGARASLANGLKVIKNASNLGFTAAVNRGIAAANRANHIFILNDDAEVVGNGLRTCLQWSDNCSKNVGLVSMCHTNSMTDREEALHPETAPESADVMRRNIELMDWTGFCAVLIRREVISKIGLLDEKHFPLYSSDKEYCMRAKAAGFITVCALEAEVYHNGSVASFKQRATNPQLFDKRASMRLENPAYMRHLAMIDMQAKQVAKQAATRENMASDMEEAAAAYAAANLQAVEDKHENEAKA